MRFLRLVKVTGEPILVNPNAIAYAEENPSQTHDGKPSTILTLRGVEVVNGNHRWPAILWVKETLDMIENKLEGYELLGESEVRIGDE